MPFYEVTVPAGTVEVLLYDASGIYLGSNGSGYFSERDLSSGNGTDWEAEEVGSSSPYTIETRLGDTERQNLSFIKLRRGIDGPSDGYILRFVEGENLPDSTAPSITSDLSTVEAVYPNGSAAAPLQVTATGSGTLSYQWQVSTTSAGDGFTDIDGATANSYTPPTDTVGDFWYRVVVSNTEEGKAPATVTSAVTPVKVTAPEGKCHVQITTSVGRSTNDPMTFALTGPDETPVELTADTSSGFAVYDLWLEPGEYRYKATDTMDETTYELGAGTIAVQNSESLQEFEFYLVYVYASVSGWTAEDFTTEVKSAGGVAMTPGEPYKFASYVAYPYLLAEGEYTFSILPSEARAEEGYQNTDPSAKTLTPQKTRATWSAKPAQQLGVTFTVPDGASVTVSTLPTHPYGAGTAVTATADSTEAEGTDSYTFPLTAGTKYVYRVSGEDLVTYTAVITASSGTKAYTVTEDMMSPGGKEPETIDRTLGSNKLDTADLRLNGVDHTGSLALKIDESVQLNPIRMWRVANGAVNNSGAMAFQPDYHYTAISADGSPSGVVEVDGTGKITAKSEGTAIVLVTYDAMYVGATSNASISNQFYSAIWPENTGVVVVEVGGDADEGPSANMTINAADSDNETNKTAGTNIDAELDVLYYSGDAGYSYTFTPESGSTVTLLRPAISETAMTYDGGFSSTGVTHGENGSITLALTEGKNIVKVSKDDQDTYQVLTVKQIDAPEITNTSNPGNPIEPGDTVEIVLPEAYNPVNQTAYLYNFYCQVTYTLPDGTTVSSKKLPSSSRDEFDGTESCRTVEVTIPADWEAGKPYTLTGGVFTITGNGKTIGTHHTETLSSLKSTLPIGTDGTLGALPNIEIDVEKAETFPVVFDVKDGETALSDFHVILTHPGGTVTTETVEEAGAAVHLGYGTYSYTISKSGYRPIRSTLTIDQETAEEGLVISLTAEKSSEGAWDGLTKTEPQKSADGVYQIGTGAELAWLADYVNQGNATTSEPVKAALTADIDLAGYDWTPIGTASNPFRGELDGQNHQIQNLYIDMADASNVGLFGNISGYNVDGGCAVRNLTVASGTVQVRQEDARSLSNIGGIAGNASYTTFENCINHANITVTVKRVLEVDAGGLIGYISDEMTVKNCGNYGDVKATASEMVGYGYGGRVGGVIGAVNRTASVSGCFNRGAIYSTGPAGGVIGYVSNSGLTSSDLYNTGAVTGGANVGGMAGYLGNGTLKNAYSSVVPAIEETAAKDANLGSAVGSQSGATLEKVFFLQSDGLAGVGGTATEGTTAKTAEELKNLAANELSGSFAPDTANSNGGYPILMWEAAVTSLQITEVPDKTTYVEGDTIDLTGMVVTATVNGQETTLDNSPLTVSPATFTETGSVTVTVSFGGQSATFTVQVNKYVPPESEDITIETTLEDGMTQRGSRRTFDVIARDASGEKIPVNDLTVKLNGTIVKHNWDDDEKTSYTLVFSQEGQNTVTITALTRTDTYTIYYEKAADGEVIGQAVFSMEAFTLGGGYLIEPCFVDILEGENSAQLLDRVLSENGFTYTNTGTLESGFYLASVSGDAVEAVDSNGAGIPQVLLDEIGTVKPRRNAASLGEFDHNSMSGWMYCVNCVFPNVGLSDYYMGDGDVMRVQFTLALGADIGGGRSGGYYTIADKDELTTLIADVGLDKVPESVRRVVEKLDATQSEVNKAVETLKNLDGTENDGSGTSDKVTSEVAPEVVVDKNGVAKVEMTDKDVSTAIENAKEKEADILVIKPHYSGEASTVVVEISKGSASSIAKTNGLDLQISTQIADVTISSGGLQNISDNADKTVAISVEAVKNNEGRATGEICVEVKADDKSVDTVDGGLVLCVPTEKASSGNVLVIVGSDGSETIVTKSVTKGLEVFGLLDGSCTVKVIDNTKNFTDTTGHWAAEAISFASSRELFQGVSATQFAPNGTMNRAMLATVLYRLAGSPARNGEGRAFTDVPLDSWYDDAVAWASENGIVSGYGNGLFGSADSVTREQLAVMFYRYAKCVGYDTSAGADLAAFTDASEISAWAREAMCWAYANGLITGRSGSMLVPQDTASRAEVATILMRFVGNMVY